MHGSTNIFTSVDISVTTTQMETQKFLSTQAVSCVLSPSIPLFCPEGTTILTSVDILFSHFLSLTPDSQTITECSLFHLSQAHHLIWAVAPASSFIPSLLAYPSDQVTVPPETPLRLPSALRKVPTLLAGHRS